MDASICFVPISCLKKGFSPTPTDSFEWTVLMYRHQGQSALRKLVENRLQAIFLKQALPDH